MKPKLEETRIADDPTEVGTEDPGETAALPEEQPPDPGARETTGAEANTEPPESDRSPEKREASPGPGE